MPGIGSLTNSPCRPRLLLLALALILASGAAARGGSVPFAGIYRLVGSPARDRAAAKVSLWLQIVNYTKAPVADLTLVLTDLDSEKKERLRLTGIKVADGGEFTWQGDVTLKPGDLARYMRGVRPAFSVTFTGAAGQSVTAPLGLRRQP